MLESSQLQTLVTVSKAGSFSRAAEELGVTQSAISQSIKSLEKRVGVTLVKRSGKTISLTTEGETLYQFSIDYLAKLEDTLTELDAGKNSMKGKVRVGTLVGVGKSWLGPELLDFASKYQEISVEVTLGFPEQLLAMFENSQLDAVVVPEYCIPPAAEKMLLGKEMCTLVFPKNSDFKITKDLTLEELSRYPTILFERDDHLYQKWCRAIFGHAPRKINRRFVVNAHGNILQAVAKGLGVAVVPLHVLKRSNFTDNIKTLGKNFEVFNSELYLVYQKESKNILRLRTLAEELSSHKNPFN